MSTFVSRAGVSVKLTKAKSMLRSLLLDWWLPADKRDEFKVNVAVNVVSGVFLAALIGGVVYLIQDYWIERNVRVTSVNGTNFGTDCTARLEGLSDPEGIVISGNVGRYFRERRSEYQIGVLITDPNDVVYVQTGAGTIADDGTWMVHDVIFRDSDTQYHVTAIAVRSVDQIRSRAPIDGHYWPTPAEFKGIEDLIGATSGRCSVTWN